MNEIKLHNGICKPLSMVLLLGALLALCVYMYYSLGISWPIWVGGVILGIPFLINLFYTLDRRAHITFSTEGIFDRQAHNDIIKWPVVKEAYAVSVYGSRYICVVVDDSFKPSNDKGNIFKKLTLFTKSLGARELHLSLRSINIDEEKLATFITKMKAANDIERTQLLAAGIL